MSSRIQFSVKVSVSISCKLMSIACKLMTIACKLKKQQKRRGDKDAAFAVLTQHLFGTSACDTCLAAQMNCNS